MGQSRQSNS
jgi:hypothetical protein